MYKSLYCPLPPALSHTEAETVYNLLVFAATCHRNCCLRKKLQQIWNTESSVIVLNCEHGACNPECDRAVSRVTDRNACIEAHIPFEESLLKGNWLHNNWSYSRAAPPACRRYLRDHVSFLNLNQLLFNRRALCKQLLRAPPHRSHLYF